MDIRVHRLLQNHENWTWACDVLQRQRFHGSVRCFVPSLQYVIQTFTHTEDMDIQLLAQIMENGSRFLSVRKHVRGVILMFGSRSVSLLPPRRPK